MLRNIKLPVYCTLCFILGCTLTISVIKYDDCSGVTSNKFTTDTKRPREIGYNSFPRENLDHKSENFKKSISSFLVVAIMSSPNNRKQRNSIRDTWATFGHREDVQHFFFIGTKDLSNEQTAVLVKEYEKNKDLVLLAEAVDSYETLTTKILLSFTWVANVADFSFLLKCDDDSFVRTPIMVKELKRLQQGEAASRLYWGFFDGRAHVRRTGKWAEPKWVICDRYLPYALGGGYVLSQDLVTLVAERASNLELYRNEDVAVGAWLSTVKGVERKHDPRFNTEYLSRGCKEDYIVTHKVSTTLMRAFFISLSAVGKLCPSGEYRTRNSYIYNWDVLPSECCVRNTSVP